jgi:hypothetical protein
MKQCKKCNIEQPLTEFYNKKDNKDGKHIYCRSCLKPLSDTWYKVSKESRADYYKTYRDQNKEYFNQYSNIHYHTKKELYREWNRTKYQTDLGFKLRHVTAARISQALKTYQTLKKDRTIEYLGCTMDEYTYYLEQMFTPDMSWDNYGEYWEIDHIKPIDAFDLNDEDQLYEAFKYTNTQPLKKEDNREKSNRYL